MNLLTINSFNCSSEAGGGVNQVTVALTRYFTHHCNIQCFLGYFEDIPSIYKPLPEIKGRIRLYRSIDKIELENFIKKNKIDILQINYLKKENICAMPQIYEVAHRLNVKVIYAFLMGPMFQVGVYASRELFWYNLRHRIRITETIRDRFYTIFKPVLDPIATVLLRKAYRDAYDSCDKIVTLSSRYFEPYKTIAGIKESDKFVAIGTELRYETYPTEEEISKKEKIVLVMARLSEQTKRVSFSLRCWKRLEEEGLFPDWKLQIMGDGRDEEFYKDLTKKWNLKRVEYIGAQVPYSYCLRSSILLMASGTEGWPMTLMEATQLGVPVVVMNSYAAVYDVIEDGYNGFIVENNNTDQYYHAMIKLMADDELRQKFAHNAVEGSKRFEVDKVSDLWLDLFNQLIPNSCRKL